MRISLFAYSRQGCKTAEKLLGHFAGEEITAYTMERFGLEGFTPFPKPAKPLYADCFARSELLIFVGSCGIAVRQTAPYVRDKRTDPAVIVTDELGRFVIPLLSGHIGGANAFALELAEVLSAVPVITTATDIHHRFSVDAWAAGEGFVIGSMAAAKAVSAAILERDLPLCSEFPISAPLPEGIYKGEEGELGIYVGIRKKTPYSQTLSIIPKILHLGIGCRRNTPKEQIEQAVEAVLAAERIDCRAVKSVSSIDLKANEEGLLAFCSAHGFPAEFYTAAELNAVEGEFTPSAFVQSITGVDNVCERSALKGADRLIIRKTARSGVTVAAAIENMEVRFG